MREQIADIRDELMGEPTADESLPEEVLAAEEETSEPLGEDVSDEAESETIEFLNDLPENVGIDTEAFYGLKLKTDTGKSYTLSEVKDFLQSRERGSDDMTKKAAELELKERQLHEAAVATVQVNQAVSKEVQQAQQEIAGIEQTYANLMSKVDEFAQIEDTVGVAKAQNELLKLQGAYGVAQQKLQHAQSRHQQFQQSAYQQYMTAQQHTLFEALPSWKEPETRQAEQQAIKTYLTSNGLTDQEINSITDARLVVLINKARQWDNHESNVQQTKAKLKVPRVIRGRHASASTKAEAADSLIAKAKESHLDRDKKAAFRAIAQQAGLL